MFDHFSSLEVYLNAIHKIFTCSECYKQVRYNGNLKRHCFKKHGLQICALTPCTQLFSDEGERIFHEENDTHYCAFCIKNYQGRRHRCYTRRPRTLTTADPDISCITDLGFAHLFRTVLSPELSPGDFDGSDLEFDSSE